MSTTMDNNNNNNNIRRLKSSLKLSRSNSDASSISSSLSSSSNKIVRFATELTTVKKFDKNDKPISISTENSPDLLPLDYYNNNFKNNNNNLSFNNNNIHTNKFNSIFNKDLWFNDISLSHLPISMKNTYDDNNIHNNNNKFDLEFDFDLDDTDDDDDDDKTIDYNFNLNFNKTKINSFNNSLDPLNKFDYKNYSIINWNLIDTNLSSFKNNSNNTNKGDDITIFNYLKGQNIKLHSINQSNNLIEGLIFVNNLNFEKFIEIKFSFNNWSDIHYITAFYNKSISNSIDEFKFIINLDSFKYFLKMKNLIHSDEKNNKTNNDNNIITPLKIELCCRYDVNNETYYDNNDYKNYEISLLVTTRNNDTNLNHEKIIATTTPVPNPISINTNTTPNDKNITRDSIINNSIPSSSSSSFYSDFLVSTTLSHKIHLSDEYNNSTSRKFTEDTDYYNTSPLKHLYHNDTTLIKPTNLNTVLTNKETSIDTLIDSNNKSDKDNNNCINITDPFSLSSDHDNDIPIMLNHSQNFDTPSLSSSLSSSFSDITPLQDFNDSLFNGKDDVFYYNSFVPMATATNINNNGNSHDDEFNTVIDDDTNTILDQKLNNNSRSNSISSNVSNNIQLDSKDNPKIRNDILNSTFGSDSISNSDISNDYFDQRQSMITDLPMNYNYNNFNSPYMNDVTDNEDDENNNNNNNNNNDNDNNCIMANNNSNDTLINFNSINNNKSTEEFINTTTNNNNENQDDNDDMPRYGVGVRLRSNIPTSLLSSSSSSANASTITSSLDNKEERRGETSNTMTTSSSSGGLIPNSMGIPDKLDYQTLLNSYCFFTPDEINNNSTGKNISANNPLQSQSIYLNSLNSHDVDVNDHVIQDHESRKSPALY